MISEENVAFGGSCSDGHLPGRSLGLGWGDSCLDCFLGMFDHNVTLLKVRFTSAELGSQELGVQTLGGRDGAKKKAGGVC